MINQEDKTSLIKLARDSIETYFSRKEPSMEKVKKFSEKQGVFVTLTKNKKLRGCIGYPEPYLPLNEAIKSAARTAAFEDPRFLPVQKDELDDIKIEISVLTIPELILVKKPEEYLKKIKIGEDGLIIRGLFRSGLLLPQVFVEYKANPKIALQMLCEKAGMNQTAWQEPNNKIYKFQAEIFHEK
jgi:AmmeMemoRadiSam system protein A